MLEIMMGTTKFQNANLEFLNVVGSSAQKPSLKGLCMFSGKVVVVG